MKFICLTLVSAVEKNKAREYIGRFVSLNRIVREDVTGNETFESTWRPGRSVSHVVSWGKNISDRNISKEVLVGGT